MSEHAPLREVDVWGKQLCSCGERYPCATVILTDLIAELRELNQNRDGGMWAEDVHDAADRAEARLKGINDE